MIQLIDIQNITVNRQALRTGDVFFIKVLKKEGNFYLLRIGDAKKILSSSIPLKVGEGFHAKLVEKDGQFFFQRLTVTVPETAITHNSPFHTFLTYASRRGLVLNKADLKKLEKYENRLARLGPFEIEEIIEFLLKGITMDAAFSFHSSYYNNKREQALQDDEDSTDLTAIIKRVMAFAEADNLFQLFNHLQASKDYTLAIPFELQAQKRTTERSILFLKLDSIHKKILQGRISLQQFSLFWDFQNKKIEITTENLKHKQRIIDKCIQKDYIITWKRKK